MQTDSHGLDGEGIASRAPTAHATRAAGELAVVVGPAPSQQTLVRIAECIARELRIGNERARRRAQRLLEDLQRHLSAVREVASPPRPTRGQLASWQVARVTQLMQARLAEHVTLEELAAAVHLSPFHFARSFKHSVGMPPHRFQISLRIGAACRLLTETTLNVTEVAARVGYEDPGYFARLFARTTGLSPSRFRHDQHARSHRSFGALR